MVDVRDDRKVADAVERNGHEDLDESGMIGAGHSNASAPWQNSVGLCAFGHGQEARIQES
jgi:hypothetical protein